jgi:hypothetical protein
VSSVVGKVSKEVDGIGSSIEKRPWEKGEVTTNEGALSTREIRCQKKIRGIWGRNGIKIREDDDFTTRYMLSNKLIYKLIFIVVVEWSVLALIGQYSGIRSRLYMIVQILRTSLSCRQVQSLLSYTVKYC